MTVERPVQYRYTDRVQGDLIRPLIVVPAVAVGMTVAQVYKSCWGKPKSINTSVLGTTKTEMLLYEGYNYVYVENGIVKSIETSGR